ncbi:hypothetical protein A6F68_01186 [Tsuneonella dongtanensis]|uniref:DUF4350 domain-containing protein n=1 Tax=Tsuneonella dongtanensis TaxID=692370 RepID=A0A1B2AC75_9SPHN|nr:DUF4350 domain-containing protein [Tsuneonella dongtanensis]ANY19704.1 hypothetical protein A6F68_01186 [Tsuneonella dongtanensis]
MNGAFNPRTVLGVLVVGALAFLAMLWFIGQGDTGSGPDNGEAHAAGHGLAGYAGLADLLERQGYEVERSRNPGRLDDEVLLVLTPTPWTDADDLAEAIGKRRYAGPTLVILPKWYALPLPGGTKDAKKGWVRLAGAGAPGFAKDLEDQLEMAVKVEALKGGPADWQGLGLAGALPDRGKVLGLDGGPFVGLVSDSAGRDLVGFADDRGCYAVLEDAAGVEPLGEDECEAKWAVTVAFEPDLFNNWGMADRNRAQLAARVVDLASEGEDFPIVFDLTLAGLGGQRNLLTLAFTPPFLAATLCLILALGIVAWRAFGRFGPPLHEGRAVAFGKTQLAANSAGFLRRSGRLHLLAAPYAAMIARRLANAFGLRSADPRAIDAALARRAPDAAPFSTLAARLEAARGPNELLRAAHALHTLERTARL